MKKQTGFTLIELAIVLVIIGLLLGGVLKGQELINSAKVKSLANDFRNIPVFVYGYQDKFKALPGDDKKADINVSAAATEIGNGNGALEGNWYDTGNTDETKLFWLHVRLAGLAQGPTAISAADFNPSNSEGGLIGIQGGTSSATATPVKSSATGNAPIKGTYVICSTGILGKYVIQIDTTMDNGDPGSGSMMAYPDPGAGNYASGVTASTINTGNATDVDAALTYVVCMGV